MGRASDRCEDWRAHRRPGKVSDRFGGQNCHGMRGMSDAHRSKAAHNESTMRQGIRNDRAAARIWQILRSKGDRAPDYWHQRGRARFERELRQDGADEVAVSAILDKIEHELFSVDLEALLADLRARELPSVSPEA